MEKLRISIGVPEMTQVGLRLEARRQEAVTSPLGWGQLETVTHTEVCLDTQRTPGHCHDSAKDGGGKSALVLPSLPLHFLLEAPVGRVSWFKAVTGDWEMWLAG